MKIVTQILCLILVCVSASSVSFAEEPYQTVLNYLNASKNGDVQTIKSLIDGPYLQKSINLLENNKNYPEFLRDYYADVAFQIVDFSILPAASLEASHPDYYRRIFERYGKSSIEIEALNEQLVQVVRCRVTFLDGETLPVSFLLEKDRSGIWKIVEKSLFR